MVMTILMLSSFSNISLMSGNTLVSNLALLLGYQFPYIWESVNIKTGQDHFLTHYSSSFTRHCITFTVCLMNPQTKQNYTCFKFSSHFLPESKANTSSQYTDLSPVVSLVVHDCHFHLSHVGIMDIPDNVKVHGLSSVELLHCSVSDPVLVSS